MAIYVFDLDGTLADCQHRMHFISNGKKDWDGFFGAVAMDTPIEHMVELYKTIANDHSNIMIVVTGRRDSCRFATELWLDRLDLITDYMFMRQDGDFRPDNIVKGEILEKLVAMGLKPAMVFDDRDQVVKMWRDAGIPCAQVAPGDF